MNKDRRPKKVIERERKYFENQQKYINRLQRLCLPGEKLITCPTCQRIGVYPEWHAIVYCVQMGNGPVCHPGQINKGSLN